MLIRCIYADAIYLVAIFWLTPLVVFVMFCLTMQIILICYTKTYTQVNIHSTHRHAYYQTPAEATSSTVPTMSSSAPIEVSDTVEERTSIKGQTLCEKPAPLESTKMICLLCTQVVVTLTMMPFLTLQLFDLMHVPTESLIFWFSDNGKLTLCILQSLPALQFVIQPLLMMMMTTSCQAGSRRHITMMTPRCDHAYSNTFRSNRKFITSI